MIGIFDSGVGGVQTLMYMREVMPEHDYCFLADAKHVPYGEKSPTVIKTYTYDALQWLFEQWCALVVVACNTAAAYVVRERQQQYPEKKVLSVTIPWVEAIIESGYTSPLILATQATVQAKVYESLLERSGYSGSVTTRVASDLVMPIEQSDMGDVTHLVQSHIADITHGWHDCIVLWCTHFPLIEKQLHAATSLPIINPWKDAARKLMIYLDRHPAIEKNITKNGNIYRYTTGKTDDLTHRVRRLFGERIVTQSANLE